MALAGVGGAKTRIYSSRSSVVTGARAGGRQNIIDASSFWTNFSAVPHKYLYEGFGIRRYVDGQLVAGPLGRGRE